MLTRAAWVVLIFLTMALPVDAQPEGFNYDESKVPDYTLPDPLKLLSGKQVESAEVWTAQRRPEIVQLFETHVYGSIPDKLVDVRFGPADVDEQSLGDAAVRKQLKIHIGGDDGVSVDLLIYLPVDSNSPAPVFVGLNFNGNHTVTDDPGVWLPSSWTKDQVDDEAANRDRLEAQRGSAGSRWPIREIVARGYGVATIYCGDIDPDVDDFQNGVHPLFYDDQQTSRAPDEWASIGAWAWGLSRALDYFEADEDVDHRQVAVFGHSRLGKTAMWSGASDQRFAMVISNESGCGGMALSRRRFGETVKRINTKFPHWFCKNFHQFNDREDELPVDQHLLAALVAPRPLYVASAEGDQWADPRGEFLSLKHASPVYELFGKHAITDAEMPALNAPILRDVGYHIRPGRHDVTDYDWQQYLDFADRHFNRP